MPDWWMETDRKRMGTFKLILGFLTNDNSEVFFTTEGMAL